MRGEEAKRSWDAPNASYDDLEIYLAQDLGVLIYLRMVEISNVNLKYMSQPELSISAKFQSIYDRYYLTIDRIELSITEHRRTEYRTIYQCGCQMLMAEYCRWQMAAFRWPSKQDYL
jgi:hypothetical protein